MTKSDKGPLYAGSLGIKKSERTLDIPMHIDAVLAATLFYRKLKALYPKDEKSFLPAIIDIINNYIKPDLENQIPSDQSIQFELSPNQFRVLSLQNLDEKKDIKFKKLPKGVKAKITDRNKHGFQVQFSPDEIHIDQFEWELK